MSNRVCPTRADLEESYQCGCWRVPHACRVVWVSIVAADGKANIWSC